MTGFVNWVTHGTKLDGDWSARRISLRLVAVVAGFLVVGVLYLLLVSHTAARGRRIQDLQGEIIRLEREIEHIEVQIAREGSIERLRARADALGFEPAVDVEFLPVRGE
jgi:hypothetical protein